MRSRQRPPRQRFDRPGCLQYALSPSGGAIRLRHGHDLPPFGVFYRGRSIPPAQRRVQTVSSSHAQVCEFSGAGRKRLGRSLAPKPRQSEFESCHQMQPSAALVGIRVQRNAVVDADRPHLGNVHAESQARAVFHVAKGKIARFPPDAA